MDTALAILATLTLLTGFVGCVVPVLPGPLLSFAGLLLLIPTRYSPSASTIVLCGALVAGVTVLDYVVPSIGAKKFQCSKCGVLGCMAGTVIGLFFAPLGLFLGPFLGAFILEMATGRSIKASFKGGFGAFLGFLATILLKLTACSVVTTAATWSFFSTRQ